MRHALTLLLLAALPAVHAADPRFAVSADAGAVPQVNVYSGSRVFIQNFLAYPAQFSGGVRVALGDIDGDLLPDTATATGSGTLRVRAFSATLGDPLQDFLPFGAQATFAGSVAVGDIDNDGAAELVVAAGAGGLVRVFDGRSGVQTDEFHPFPSDDELRIAVGYFDDDRYADYVLGRVGDGTVIVRSGRDRNRNLRVISSATTGPTAGHFVALGDVNGDGRADIVTGADAGAFPEVRVYSGSDGSLLFNFIAYNDVLGGVRVASADLDGDGAAEIVTANGPGTACSIRFFDGNQSAGSLAPFGSSFTGGCFIAATTGEIPTVFRDGCE